jgi:hypothetical protein
LDLEVLKRGKAGKEVEFGNKFYLSENEQGYILDFLLSARVILTIAHCLRKACIGKMKLATSNLKAFAQTGDLTEERLWQN